ncbi:MAG TPA: efflux RND transporter periplasmic adaptor subunit, partial [Calditrichia bacterium]|nr:efflux RND transporter periplasmic adaptor subunit [Calditrichia bacterium]
KRDEVFSKRRPVGLALAALAGLLLLVACSEKAGENARGENRLIPAVEAVQAREGTLPLTQRLSGVVKAKNQVAIYPQISAVVTEVLVTDGQTVNKGEPLVRLRDKEFRDRLRQATANQQIVAAQLRQAEARLREIEAELKRVQTLAAQELSSPAELESMQTRAVAAEADVELARARLEQAEANAEEQKENLSQTVIRAPVSGSVGNRDAEVGMLVNPNRRLFTLGQLDNVQVEVVLTDHMLHYLEEGQRSEILSGALPQGLAPAALSRISPFLHPVSHTTEAEIDLPNPEGYLKPGMFVTVDIFYGESERATLLPLSALYENPSRGETGVYLSKNTLIGETSGKSDDDGRLALTNPQSLTFVAVDVVAKGRMEAGVRGVDPGDWVVTLGQNLLGPDSGRARIRPVKWDWVQQLQNLQREDLMEEVVR